MNDQAEWLRRPDESAEAYKAFQTYLRLPVPRSIDAAYGKQQKRNKSAAKADGRASARAAGNWTKWATQHQWVERARLYDEHNERVREEARQAAMAAESAKWAKRQEQQRERDYTIGERLQTRAQKLAADGSVFDSITPSSVARMAEAGSKLARLAAGMATDRPTVHITGNTGAPTVDLSDKSDEQLQDYLRALAATALAIASSASSANGAGSALAGPSEPAHPVDA